MSLLKFGRTFVKFGNSIIGYSGPVEQPDVPLENFFQLTNRGSDAATLRVTSGSNGYLFVDDVYAGKFSANREKAFDVPAGSVVKVVGLTSKGGGYSYGTMTATEHDSISLDRFDESLPGLDYMFSYFMGLTSVTSWNGASGYTTMWNAFLFSTELSSIPPSWAGLGSVTSLFYSFNGTGLTAIPDSWAGLDSIQAMTGTFGICAALTSIPEIWDVSDTLTSIEGIFSNCSSLTSMPRSWAGLENVTNITAAFAYCAAITDGGTDGIESLSNVTSCNITFDGCSSWEDDAYSIYEYLNTKSIPVLSHSGTFNNCKRADGYYDVPVSWGGGKN